MAHAVQNLANEATVAGWEVLKVYRYQTRPWWKYPTSCCWEEEEIKILTNECMYSFSDWSCWMKNSIPWPEKTKNVRIVTNNKEVQWWPTSNRTQSFSKTFFNKKSHNPKVCWYRAVFSNSYGSDCPTKQSVTKKRRKIHNIDTIHRFLSWCLSLVMPT